MAYVACRQKDNTVFEQNDKNGEGNFRFLKTQRRGESEPMEEFVSRCLSTDSQITIVFTFPVFNSCLSNIREGMV